MQLEILHKPL